MLNITQVESSLWEAADQLRANSRLNANEYSMPVLGLIFLGHATNRFKAVKVEIEKTLPSRGGKKRPITKDDFKGKAAIFYQKSLSMTLSSICLKARTLAQESMRR